MKRFEFKHYCDKLFQLIVILSPIIGLGMFDSLQSKTVHIEPNQTTVLNCSTSKSIPNAKVQWMMKDEDGLQNFVHEDRNHVIDDNGKLYEI
ncbi:unnamed protein product [Trichobilharzia regenti]|nr:unnamed protein product [Trichobilharzia regenti]